MSKKRRQHSTELKARVALEALKGIEPVHAIAAKYQVHPVQVSQWKKELLERLPEVFARKAPPGVEEAAEKEAKPNSRTSPTAARLTPPSPGEFLRRFDPRGRRFPLPGSS